MTDARRLSGNRFLVIGRAGMDFYAEPPGTPLEDAGMFRAALGGSSANIAAALVRQGASASLVTCVSDDAVGLFARNELDRYGIDRRHVRVVGGEARNSLAVVDTNGDKTKAVIYRNHAADFQMDRRDVEAVDYTAFDALVTTGTVLAAEPSRDAAFRAFELARAAGQTVVFDLDYRPYSWPSDQEAREVYAKASEASDIVIGNDVEFGVLAGAAEDGLDAARALTASGKTVVYKMGHEGAVTLHGDGETRTGIYKTDALKPTGAGDAFMGGFLAALAGGHDLRTAVQRGSASAAIVVARVGCAPACPTTEELDAFLATHEGPTEPS
ncbi:MAG: 5-dehydro-2-deoxygluconokinase [Pseudomonadota bacterium]